MNGGGSWKVGIYGPYISQNTYPISRLSCLNADNPNSIKGSKIKNKKGRRRNKISAIK